MNGPLNSRQQHGNIQGGYRPSGQNNPVLSGEQLKIVGLLKSEAKHHRISPQNYQLFMTALSIPKNNDELKALIGAALNKKVIDSEVAKALENCLVEASQSPPQNTINQRQKDNSLPDKINKKFTNIELLGQGGMGAVYKAKDINSGRDVAIKTILGAADIDDLLRFKLEAQAISKLSHPAIPQGHELIESDGNLYFVQEVISGKDFDKRINELYGDITNPPDLEDKQELLEALVQIANGLDYAHKNGVAHRDLKPANIIYSDEGQAKLIDFGLAKITSKEDGSANSQFSQGMSLTQDGMVLGTPAYMAPEQIAGLRKNDDGQTVDYKKMDIFALGAILNKILTGRLHLKARDHVGMAMELDGGVYQLPIDDPTANIPSILNDVVAKALEKDPNNRYESAGAFAKALQNAIDEIYYEEESPKKAKSSKSLIPLGVGGSLTGAALTLLVALNSGEAPKKILPKKRKPRISQTENTPKANETNIKAKDPTETAKEKIPGPSLTEKTANQEVNETDFDAVFQRSKARFELATNKNGEVVNEDWLSKTIEDCKILYGINKNQYDFLVFFSKVRIAEGDLLSRILGKEVEAARAYEQAFKKFDLKGFKKLVTQMKLAGNKEAYKYLFYEAKARLGRATINSGIRNLRQDVKNSIKRDLKDAAAAISEYMGATKPSGSHLKECQKILSKINKLAIR